MAIFETLKCTNTAKSRFTLGLNATKSTQVRIMSKISLNKSCSELNFVQKSQLTHMSISSTPPPQVELGVYKYGHF